MECLLSNTNSVLELSTNKKVNKYKLKLNKTTLDYCCPSEYISFKKIIPSKHPQAKEIFHKKYADCRNLLSTILKKSETKYYNQYFQLNRNNIGNTWNGIVSI